MLRAVDIACMIGGTQALCGVSMSVGSGEVVSVSGPSGSGKSTLLHCLGGILRPSRGEVWFDGERLDDRTDRQRSDLRLRRFGVVQQFGALIPELTLLENVELPLRLTGCSGHRSRELALSVMTQLEIGDLGGRRAGEASGGQVQRAAVARALVHRPAVVLADEPTGSLDSAAGERVLSGLIALARELGAAVVLVTHESGIAARADRSLSLVDGRLSDGAELSA